MLSYFLNIFTILIFKISDILFTYIFCSIFHMKKKMHRNALCFSLSRNYNYFPVFSVRRWPVALKLLAAERLLPGPRRGVACWSRGGGGGAVIKKNTFLRYLISLRKYLHYLNKNRFFSIPVFYDYLFLPIPLFTILRRYRRSIVLKIGLS